MLENRKSELLQSIYEDLDTLEDVHDLIEGSIVDDPPFSVREGGIIREGYNQEVDELRKDMTGGKDYVAAIEKREREKTGIPKLRVGYNRVFGYYLEVTNSYKDQVPDSYIRKQTLTNCERYVTQELKDLEGRILGAKDRCVQLEYRLFDDIRTTVSAQQERVQKTSNAIAQLDVLCSFARVAVKNPVLPPGGQFKRENCTEGKPPSGGGAAFRCVALCAQRRAAGSGRKQSAGDYRPEYGGKIPPICGRSP